MFAVALTLVVLVSSAVLLYQYWSGSLLVDDADRRADRRADASPEPTGAPEVIRAASSLHIDHAA